MIIPPQGSKLRISLFPLEFVVVSPSVARASLTLRRG
jgi:hypothetical protein